MPMKRSMFSLVFVVGLLLICAGSASASWAPGYIHGTIWGGKSIDIAGYIVEQIPGNKIKITINPVDPWELRDVHIAIVTDPALFPTNKAGNPKLNKFWHESRDPSLLPFIKEFSLNDIKPGWNPGDSLFIMIKIASEQYDSFGNLIADETGWAGPCINTMPDGWNPSMPWPEHFWPFSSPRWAYYFEFVLI